MPSPLLRLAGSLSTAFLRVALGARRKTLSIPPVSLVYYAVGPRGAEPWVFLHGLGSIGSTWTPVVRSFHGSCRVLVPELSALGGTRAPDGGLGVRQGAGVVAALVEREWGGRPVTVAGLSLGGWMAVRLALSRPELVSRLVLIDAAGYRDQDWERIHRLVAISDLAGVQRLYRALFVHTPWLLRVSRRAFLDSYTQPGVRKVLTATGEDDTFDDRDLARIAVPTAVVWGEGDGLFDLAAGRAMAAAIPGSTLSILPGCGHGVHLECPRRLADALAAFRRAHPAAGGPGLPSAPPRGPSAAGTP